MTEPIYWGKIVSVCRLLNMTREWTGYTWSIFAIFYTGDNLHDFLLGYSAPTSFFGKAVSSKPFVLCLSNLRAINFTGSSSCGKGLSFYSRPLFKSGLMWGKQTLCRIISTLYHMLKHIMNNASDGSICHPVSILRKSISGRHRPVRVADGPMTARCRFT